MLHGKKHEGQITVDRPRSLVAFIARNQDEHIDMDYFHVFWVFLVCSFVGLIVETLVSYPIDGVWKNRAGLVWGPLSPIYGVGGVLMTVGLHRFQHAKPITVFLIAAFIGASFEFLAGWFFETAFGIVAWSYADQPFNLMGHTCLGIAIVWGLLGLVWTKVLMPDTFHLINRIPQKARRPLTIILTAYIILDVVMTLLCFNFWYARITGQPATNMIQAFFYSVFNDEFMAKRFQTMSIFSDLAKR